MGTLKSGLLGTYIGKMGDYVSYYLNGKVVVRYIGKVDHWTDPQLEVQMRMTLVSILVKTMKDFINASFRHTPKPIGWSANNMAVSLNNPGVVSGVYPDLAIDFGKVILSKGDIPVPQKTQVSLTDNAIKFSWAADLEAEKADENDQVMCLAYFPGSSQVFTVLSGNKRGAEEQMIALPSFTSGMVIETYLCFVSEDRMRTSDSVYTGRLIWDKN